MRMVEEVSNAVVSLALGRRLEKSLNTKVMVLSSVLAGNRYFFTLVVPALRKSTWQKLILSKNNLEDAGVQALGETLDRGRANQIFLRILWLDDNGITSAALRSFCKTRTFSQLEELWLDDNQIDDDGLESLCEGLRRGSSLLKLGLSMNMITDAGVKILAKLLGDRTTGCYLQVLNLSSNRSITDAGINEILAGVKLSRLMRLDLEGNAVSNQQIENIKFLVKFINSKRFKLLVTLCSSRTIYRIGAASAIRSIPIELIIRLVDFLMWPAKRT